MKRNTVRNTRLGGVGNNTLATTGQLLPLKYPKGILWHYLTPPAPRQISVPVERVAAQYIIGWLSLFHKGLLNASVKNFCRENICKSHFRNLDYILNSIWLRYIDANQTACHQWCITCILTLCCLKYTKLRWCVSSSTGRFGECGNNIYHYQWQE